MQVAACGQEAGLCIMACGQVLLHQSTPSTKNAARSRTALSSGCCVLTALLPAFAVKRLVMLLCSISTAFVVRTSTSTGLHASARALPCAAHHACCQLAVLPESGPAASAGTARRQLCTAACWPVGHHPSPLVLAGCWHAGWLTGLAGTCSSMHCTMTTPWEPALSAPTLSAPVRTSSLQCSCKLAWPHHAERVDHQGRDL